MTDDVELLRRYAEQRSEEAFAELVQRHLGLVYQAALRQLGGDAHRAKDVAQRVFTDLARKAAGIGPQTSVAGWLHTSTRYAAAQVRRTEGRRQKREQAAQAIETGPAEPAASADWDRLRPVIDEAIGALNERDREAVLMRFFENRPFAEIGERFFTTEDAARVRVNRALEKLQSLLAQHGVTSTTAALALVLEGQAALTPPAGLTSTVTAAATTAAATGGGGLAILSFMTTTKFFAGTAGAIALLAIGTAVYQGRKAAALEAAAASTQRDAVELRERLQQLESRVEAEIRRAQAADEDNARLIEAMDRLAEIRRDDAETREEASAVTEDSVNARFRRGTELARTGRLAEALEDFLWCYDDGMTRFPRFYGVRNSFLTGQLGELAKRYPPAREALLARRNAAEARMRASETELESAMDYAALNDALGESTRTLAAFDRLAPDDPRRASLGVRLFGTLITQKRYAEAVQSRSYAQMRGGLELVADRLTEAVSSGRPGGALDATRINAQRSSVVRSTASDVEALAGAGDVVHARALAERLLEFDGSVETRGLLQQHAARAGRPDLLQAATSTATAR